MTVTVQHSRSDGTAIVARAGLLGVWAGGAAGLITGTIAVPVLGTIVGAVIGCQFGGLIGLANGLALAALSRLHGGQVPPLLFRVVPALLSAGLGFVVFGADLSGGQTGKLAFILVMTALCALLGLLLGPKAIRRPTPARSFAVAPVTRGAGLGAVTGAVGAALAGVGWGLMSYPPTAWFAGMELGTGGAVVGATLGTVIGGFVSVRRSWHSYRGERRPPA